MLSLKNLFGAPAPFFAGLLLAQSSIAHAQSAPAPEPPPAAPVPGLTTPAPAVAPAPTVTPAPPALPTYATGKPAEPTTPAAAAPASGPSIAAAPGKGVTVTSADGNYSMMIRPRVQLRGTLTKDDATTGLEVQVRTLRLVMAGNVLSPDLKYYIQLAFGGGDFDNGSASPIFDAFVEYTKFRDFNLRVGQFFVPFDRARTTREFGLQFVDRQGVVRELTLDRDVGIMLSSQDLLGLGGKLGYYAFVGGGDGKNRFADSKNKYGPQTPGALFVGRLVARPFGAFDDDLEGDLTRTATPKLLIGVGAAYNLSSDRDHSTYGNTYTLGTFNYTHVAADMVFKWHGFSFFHEFLYRNANKESITRTVSGAPVTERSRSGYGYFAQVGQMVTKQLEVVARAETLKGKDSALKTVARASGRQVGGGLNLYLNGHFFKLQTDYFYVFGDDIGRGQHVARIQLDASF
ncbi:MAG TPA: porin [Polyangiales bacterium]